MPFNENQVFYASVWWMASLPGGRQHVSDICHSYGMAAPELRTASAKGDPVSREQAFDFFETLYNTLQNGEVPVQQVTDGSGAGFIALKAAAENALAVAGLPAGALSPDAAMFLHDDGQILTPLMIGKKQKTIPQDYPGQPPTPYRMVNLSAENFFNRPAMTVTGLFAEAAGPLPDIEVHEALQIGQGGSYTVTGPGDHILWCDPALQVVRKSQIDSGGVSLIPHIPQRPDIY